MWDQRQRNFYNCSINYNLHSNTRIKNPIKGYNNSTNRIWALNKVSSKIKLSNNNYKNKYNNKPLITINILKLINNSYSTYYKLSKLIKIFKFHKLELHKNTYYCQPLRFRNSSHRNLKHLIMIPHKFLRTLTHINLIMCLTPQWNKWCKLLMIINKLVL